jgi:hypothetical protein
MDLATISFFDELPRDHVRRGSRECRCEHESRAKHEPPLGLDCDHVRLFRRLAFAINPCDVSTVCELTLGSQPVVPISPARADQELPHGVSRNS